MAPVTVNPGMSFAKVAAAANKTSIPFSRPVDASPPKLATLEPHGVPSLATMETKFAEDSAADTQAQGQTLPVSEENINQLTIAHQSSKQPVHSAVIRTSAAPSIATFPNDEKESLRPDDSASIKGGPDDGIVRPIGQNSSTISSNSDVRAFHDQLDEIASVDQSHATPNMHRIAPAMLPHDPAAPPFQSMPYMDGCVFPNVPMGTASDTTNFLGPSNEPDEKLVEALFGKDRLWLLKLEQDIIKFIHNARLPFHDIQQCSNSFYRMLAHRVSDYYLLAHTLVEGHTDRTQAIVRLLKTPGTRLPPPLISYGTQPGAPDSASGPAPMKILRRDDTRPNSRDGKDNADGDSGSDASRSKQQITREERTARYEAARLRIMGSARPSETDLTASNKDDDASRTSMNSATKRKPPKKLDTDDDFEARSAYNTYRSPTNAPNEYGYPPLYQAPPGYPYGPQPPFVAPFGPNGMYPPPTMSPDSEGSWPAYPPIQYNPNDLSRQFSQSMTMQQGGYPTMYPPPAQSWSPGPDVMFPYGMPPGQYMNNERGPGGFRPLHFNAQSQAFVPGQSPIGQFPGGWDYKYNPDRRRGNGSEGGPSRQNSFRHNGKTPDKRVHSTEEFRSGPKPPTAAPQSADSIHKWATPASLPAKPPTPASMAANKAAISLPERYQSAAAMLPGVQKVDGPVSGSEAVAGTPDRAI